MATYRTTSPGNLQDQIAIWTLTPAEARAACTVLDCHAGSYWDATLAAPYRSAHRARATTVRVYTAGVRSGQLCHALCATGTSVAHEEARTSTDVRTLYEGVLVILLAGVASALLTVLYDYWVH